MKILKFLNFSGLEPKKRLKYFKFTFYLCIAIMLMMSFLSLGVTGSNFMIWRDMQTQYIKDIMDQHHTSFFTSQQFIIAFDVLCIMLVMLLTYSVLEFYTKGNMVILIISIVFWTIRWAASIFYLSTDKSLREQNQKKFNLIYTSSGQLNPLCKAQECAESLLNYVECGKILVWKQLEHFQVGFLVITILIGIGFFFVAYKTNQLDVSLEESSTELEERAD